MNIPLIQRVDLRVCSFRVSLIPRSFLVCAQKKKCHSCYLCGGKIAIRADSLKYISHRPSAHNNRVGEVPKCERATMQVGILPFRMHTFRPT